MTALHAAAILAVMAAFGHSFLSERLFLRPLRARSSGASAAGSIAEPGRMRLVTLMFHMPSLFWAVMAVCLLALAPVTDSSTRFVFNLFAGVFLLSGLGNFWATRRIHPGGVVLLLAGACVLGSLYA